MKNIPIDKLIAWYRKNKRDLPWRNTRDIYRIWLSEVMLQQTQVKTVIPYYHAFLERFPDVAALAAADEDTVLKAWEGLGFYNRCLNMYNSAKMIMSFFRGKIPETPDKFYILPGVGKYTLAAVMSTARDFPLPAVDTNVIRVYTRFNLILEPTGKTALLKKLTRELGEIIPADIPGEFNQAMMELGALVCLPKKPHCADCPLREECLALKNGQSKLVVTKIDPRPIPIYRVALGIISKPDEPRKFYIQKRPAYGHLSNMWEFPGGKQRRMETLEETLLRKCKKEVGVTVEVTGTLAEVKHSYSHFRVKLTVFMCRIPGTGDRNPNSSPAVEIKPLKDMPFRWITIDQLDQFPFPGANHKFFPLLREKFQK